MNTWSLDHFIREISPYFLEAEMKKYPFSVRILYEHAAPTCVAVGWGCGVWDDVRQSNRARRYFIVTFCELLRGYNIF
jgi:hypothetical protein